MKNLSQKINDFIENYEYEDFSKINFGTVIYNIAKEYDLRSQSEEECINALDDLKETWIRYEYIRETISESSLLFYLQMTNNRTLEKLDEVINEHFKIFNKIVILDECFENRLTITYYRNPEYNEKRHYIEVILLLEPDNKIKKILNIKKGCKW